MILAVIALSLIACDDPAPERRSAVRDSAGVTIVEHGPVEYASLPAWSLSEEPLVSIGVLEGDEAYQFGYVEDARRLADGSFVVVDRDYMQVRRYDALGAHLWTSGRAGDGPGEFRAPTEVRPIAGDSVVVWDAVRRLTVLAPDGQWARSEPVPDVQGVPTLFGVLASGDLLIRDRTTELVDESRWLLIVHEADVRRMPSSADSAPVIATRPVLTYHRDPDDVEATYQPLFSTPAVAAATTDGLWFGSTRRYELERLDTAGKVERVVRWSGPDRSIDDRDVNRWISWLTDGMDDDMAKWAQDTYSDWPVADSLPAYDRVMVDEVGQLWLRDYDKDFEPVDAKSWTIVSADGTRFLGRAEIPTRFEPLQIARDWMLGVDEDELGIDRVQLFGLGPG